MFTARHDHLPKLRLGDTCHLLGITPRAVRFYEEQGLVDSHRDRQNHRYIDGESRRRLAWIIRLRRAGLSVRDVRLVLQAEDAGREHRHMLLSRLETRRRRLMQDLAEVDSLMADLGDTEKADTAPAAEISAAA